MDATAVANRTLNYLATPSVVGFEQPFLRLLAEEAAALGRDAVGQAGLLAVPGEGTVVSAHIDRHGLVTRPDGLLGYAAHEAAGAHRPLTPRLAVAVCSRFDQERVVAYDAATGLTLAEGTVVHADHCGIGPDLDLAAAGLDGVPPGTPVAFAAPPGWDGAWLRGQLDNALSAALAMELLAAGFGGTVLFTRGEEAGRSWEALRDYLTAPTRSLIVLDTSPFDDSAAAAAGAVVLRHADSGAEFDTGAAAVLATAAAEEEAPVVWKDAVLAAAGRSLGRTELGRLIAATAGLATGATLQIPTTDYHSNHEATTAAAVGAAWAVLRNATA